MGEKQISFTVGDTQVDLYLTPERHFGAMLLFLTGPAGYNIWMRKLAKDKGYLLNQWGLWDRRSGELIASTEEEIYSALGTPYEPPELRGKGGRKIMLTKLKRVPRETELV